MKRSKRDIWCLFVGITGNIRGINFDDYRPDYIVLDDILTDENCATHEQREKISDLVHGALKKSLAPVVDDPNAKMCMLVTPQHREDVSTIARGDATWKAIEVGCWSPSTQDASPLIGRNLCGPSGTPPPFQPTKKRAAISINRVVRVQSGDATSPHLTGMARATERTGWRKYHTDLWPVPDCTNVLSIDPTPPPSEAQMAKGFVGDDFEVIHVWGRRGDNFYLQERRSSRGWFSNFGRWSMCSRLALKYRVVSIVVESVNYQQTLKWLLGKEMSRRRQYFSVIPFVGKNKYARIRSSLRRPRQRHGHIAGSAPTTLPSSLSSPPIPPSRPCATLNWTPPRSLYPPSSTQPLRRREARTTPPSMMSSPFTTWSEKEAP